MEKLVEGLWDCPYCGSKKIRASLKNCPHCGHPQDENTKFYLPDAITYVPDEKASKISRNPDWQCSFCGSLNKDTDNNCRNCNATKDDSEKNYFEMRQEQGEKAKNASHYSGRNTVGNTEENTKNYEESSFSTQSYSSNARSGFNLKAVIAGLLGLTGIGLIIAFIVALFIPNLKEVTVNDFKWERSIGIEEFITCNESDWSLPSDARLQYTQSEIKEYQPIIDHYKTVTETKTRPVFDHNEAHTSYKDLGNGYFEKHAYYTPVYRNETYTETHQEPVYRQEPVYATKYYYEIDRWQTVAHAVSSGNDQKPYWSKPKLGSKQKTGIKTERYSVIITYKNKKNKDVTKEYTMKYSEWKKLKKGKNVKLKLNKLGYAEIPNKDEASSGFVSNSNVDE